MSPDLLSQLSNELSNLLQAPLASKMGVELFLDFIIEEGLINEIAKLQDVSLHLESATHEHLLHALLGARLLSRGLGVAYLCEQGLVLC